MLKSNKISAIVLILASKNIITCLFSSQTLTCREGSGIISSIYTIWEPLVSVSGSTLPHLTTHTHGTPDNNTDAGSCHVLNIAAYLTIVMGKLESTGGRCRRSTEYIARFNGDFRNTAQA